MVGFGTAVPQIGMAPCWAESWRGGAGDVGRDAAGAGNSSKTSSSFGVPQTAKSSMNWAGTSPVPYGLLGGTQPWDEARQAMEMRL